MMSDSINSPKTRKNIGEIPVYPLAAISECYVDKKSFFVLATSNTTFIYQYLCEGCH